MSDGAQSHEQPTEALATDALADALGRRVDPDGPLALRCHRSNLVNVPAAHLSTVAYNEDPKRLRIGATRREHAALFEALDASPNADIAADGFQHDMG